MKGSLKITLISILSILVLIVVVFALLDGSFLPIQYDVEKDIYSESDDNYTLEQFQLIQGGLLAASSHNMQPWLIRIVDEDTMELHIDNEKLLHAVDKENNQTIIGQGTFIQSMILRGKSLGIKLKVVYHEPNFSDEYPHVATISVIERGTYKVDVLTSSTYAISTGEQVDIASTIENVINNMNTIETQDGEKTVDIQYEWIGEQDKTTFQDFLLRGTTIESNDEEAMVELLDIFRFTKWDKNKYKYGLSLSTMSPLMQPFLQPILKYTTNWESFGKQGIDAFKTRLEDETNYILLKGKTDFETLVKVGEIYTELQNTLGGWVIKPAYQVLQTYDSMKELNNEFQDTYGKEVSVQIIIGVKKSPDKSFISLRHKVEDIVIEE